MGDSRSSNSRESSTPLTSREASYLNYLDFLKEGHFLREASSISYGACKQARSLDYIAAKYSKTGKLSLKLKEKALLRCALYEYYYMKDSPKYAVGDEMVKLAKKYCHPTFGRFLNSLLRNLPEALPEFPSLAIRTSYPDKLVNALKALYPLDQVEKILEVGNLPAKTKARIRPGFEMKDILPTEVESTAQSKEFYIMNSTPAALISELSSKITAPKSILDLCASPGGKLLALHDLFPEAELFANDISQAKLRKLHENVEKYDLKVSIREGLGEEYPLDRKFDLVILDVPCSNTGVLAKHPEARWRENSLAEVQNKLFEHAKKLVAPQGHIFYLTCSILPEENPTDAKLFEKTILPLEQGVDGGYGALFGS